jgi:hypothetical protein
VTLSTTWLRTADGARLIVPNQVVTTSVIRNDTIGREPVTPTASVWIAPAADAAAALSALSGLPGASGAAVEETVVGGTRVSATGAPVDGAERVAAEAALRADALAALQAAGVERAGTN